MKVLIKSDNVTYDVLVENISDRESVIIWQDEGHLKDYNMIMLVSEEVARKTIKAIKKAAKELKWKI